MSAPATNSERPRSATESARRLLPPPGGLPALDRLAELAAQLLNAPSAQVSLLTEQQTVTGAAGSASRGTSPLPDSLCTVTAGSGRPLVVADASTDVRVAGLPPVVQGAVGAYLGAPLVADSGDTVGALCVFGPEPRSWSEADVSVLTRLAASVVAELELAALGAEYDASRALWESAVRAGGIGTFDWNLATGVLRWDPRMLELFGYDDTEFDFTLDSFTRRLHPEDAPRVDVAIRAAIDSCGGYDAEYRVLLPGGETRWLAARGQVTCDDAGRPLRLIGTAYDTTTRRDADARVARVLESMNAAFFLLDSDWRFRYVNGTAESVLGRSREELLGGDVWELFPLARNSPFETHYRHAMTTGQPTAFEAYYPPPLAAWFEVQASPGPDGLSVYFLDITARRAAQELAEHAAERAQLLSEVTRELSETLDAEQAVGRLAQLVVPALGDWCVVTLVDDDEHAGSTHGLRDIGSWHADPALRPAVERYCQIRLSALTDQSYLWTALETGQPVRVGPGATSGIREMLSSAEARELIGQLAPDTASVLPLRGRGRTVGVLTVYNGRSRGPVDSSELGTLVDAAGRAGLALDNARLYRQQRRLAEELQRSMLTPPPEPDHVQVVVRYQPAAEAAQVGGDWYDAFLQPGGATVLVIGDVIGHDTAAAAAMGQVRTLLRGLAAAGDAGPADVLRQVDAVMQTLQVATTATVIVARIEQNEDERERGITRLRWSNAGHPPLIVIHPDGTVAPLPTLDADLLLGIDPTSSRAETAVVLDRGSTVLLYTDGLVERRGQSLDEGLNRLRDVLAGLASQDLGLDELCDATLRELLPGHPEDDVALVAVRLHRQDRPRPPEAGPNDVPPNVP